MNFFCSTLSVRVASLSTPQSWFLSLNELGRQKQTCRFVSERRFHSDIIFTTCHSHNRPALILDSDEFWRRDNVSCPRACSSALRAAVTVDLRLSLRRLFDSGTSRERLSGASRSSYARIPHFFIPIYVCMLCRPAVPSLAALRGQWFTGTQRCPRSLSKFYKVCFSHLITSQTD